MKTQTSVKECVEQFRSLSCFSDSEPHEEVDASECFRKGLLNPSLTPLTVACFAPCFSELLLTIPISKVNSTDLAVSLARTIDLHPSLTKVVLTMMEEFPSPFDQMEFHSSMTEEEVCFRLLSCYLSSSEVKKLWKMEEWLRLLHHQKGHIRWCAIMAISNALHLAEQFCQRLMKLYDISEEECLQCSVKLSKQQNEHLPILPETQDYIHDSKKRPLGEMEKNSSMGNAVRGIQLPVSRLTRKFAPRRKTGSCIDSEKRSTQQLIRTDSVEQNLFRMALSIKQRQALLLEGPPGSGKTMMIQEMLGLTGNEDAIHVQVDDQMDAKSLLGAYVCTSTPGEFRWQQGPLAEAVSEGKWIIIEDINLAPTQVLASLIPLLDSEKLPIPQRAEELQAREDFQIIMTVTSAPRGLSSGAYVPSSQIQDVLCGLLTHLVVETPPLCEQLFILTTLFPKLGMIIPHSLACLRLIQLMSGQTRCTSVEDDSTVGQLVDGCLRRSRVEMSASVFHVGRHFSMRDVCKWCTRLTTLHKDAMETLSLKEGDVDVAQVPYKLRYAALIECHDCYAAFIPRQEHKKQVMSMFAALWNLPETDIELQTETYKPLMKVDDRIMTMGRAQLPIWNKWMLARGDGALFVHSGGASRLMERVSVCLAQNEPVLLVGETGTGKTALIQHIAHQVKSKLVILNLSQQTDSSELIGGYKPISSRDCLLPLVNPFVDLVRRTWRKGNNEAFMAKVLNYAEKEDWIRLKEAFEMAVKKFQSKERTRKEQENKIQRTGSKRQKQDVSVDLKIEWHRFEEEMKKACLLHEASTSTFAFTFVEGMLLKALREGYWLFLDEINLAPPEALQALASVLESNSLGGDLSVPDKGSSSVTRHPHFRLVGAMNPATDNGKRDLSSALRNKFTEFWCPEPTSVEDLEFLVASYLSALGPSMPITRLVQFYLQIKEESRGGLTDGGNQSPCYSLRTLCRFLKYIKKMIGVYGLERVLYDGALMAFGTQLDSESTSRVLALINELLLEEKMDPRRLQKTPQKPKGRHCVLFEQFWIETGPEEIPELDSTLEKPFVLTSSIRTNLRSLARAAALRKYPILLQGPTSSGKTSLVSYLAAQTGHKMIRINNHEHTDLQEYLGSYIANEQGHLEFVEGALVQAVKKGYWVVLDELNLAPSEVLEALNRLLDDNRELFIPDLQQTIKPHPHFLLFATQNPPGIYAGRKHLSRAFRGRFLEINVDDIPDGELAEILEHRSRIPRSYANKMVQVMRELQRRRQVSNAFAGRFGFITPRDLFRWAERPVHGYLQLAQNGYFTLAERLRNPDEKQVVQEVICGIMKVEFGELYELDVECPGLAWIPSTQRIFSLLDRCLQSSEAALLVGDTGTGKTTVCQKLAERNGQKLHILNCNLYTETSDFIGGFRPVRDRSRQIQHFRQLSQSFISSPLWTEHSINPGSLESFHWDNLATKEVVLEELEKQVDIAGGEEVELMEMMGEMKGIAGRIKMPFGWEDGVLIEAMKNGDMILIDELNLAEDAVLERMNSVLDIGRSITLAEKGGEPSEVVIAHPAFRLVATMNPGGDFGKKELSPAMTNRFSQIWVPQITQKEELIKIVESQLDDCQEKYQLNEALVLFYISFQRQTKTFRQVFTLRDLLSVVRFVNMKRKEIGAWCALLHGIGMVFLDGLEVTLQSGLGPQFLHHLHSIAYHILLDCLPEDYHHSLEIIKGDLSQINCLLDEKGLSVGPFSLALGPHEVDRRLKYDIRAPTPKRNVFCLLRAMQLNKAILLEGSPGVGKTSLVVSLAKLTGHQITRINLSEQTDMMDLLGADLPVSGGQAGEFQWCDGPLLSAIKSGDWILLDELNLANQQVLEGLNALTDHRAEIYIPELKETFCCPSSFHLFASQNPSGQGSGRKGLPRSFLNRFTRVYLEPLDQTDMMEITTALSGNAIDSEALVRMVRFLSEIGKLCEEGKVGCQGGPWEFNLRDFLRWSDLLERDQNLSARLNKAAEILFLQRFRSLKDKEMLSRLYENVFGVELKMQRPRILVSDKVVVIGDEILSRKTNKGHEFGLVGKELFLLPDLTPFLESLAVTVNKNWPVLLVGPSCSGKTSLVRILAMLCNEKLVEISLTSGTDAGDLLGGFEQIELQRDIQRMLEEGRFLCSKVFALLISQSKKEDVPNLLMVYGQVLEMDDKLTDSVVDGKRKLDLMRDKFAEIFASLRVELNKHQDLITDDLGENIEDFLNRLQNLNNLESTAGCFGWVDGALVKAIEEGNWVLLDHANLCNSSILDRLNSVLEPNGALHLNECGVKESQNGSSRVIHPHPNFRIFLAYNPKHGEISRAMRNRVIEIYLPNEISVSVESCLDLPSLWNSVYKVNDLSGCLSLATAHYSSQLKSKLGLTHGLTIRDFRQSILSLRTLQEAHYPIKNAVEMAWSQIYSHRCDGAEERTRVEMVMVENGGNDVPDWVQADMSVVQMSLNSSLSSMCRETYLLWKCLQSKDRLKSKLVFQIVIPIMTSKELRLLKLWVEVNFSQNFTGNFLDNLVEKKIVKDFFMSVDFNSPIEELLPFDSSYWDLRIPVSLKRPDHFVLELLLWYVQFQSALQEISQTINSKSLQQNSVLHLSCLKSYDIHFRPSFSPVSPLIIEWIYPVFSTLDNIMEESFESLLLCNLDILSLLKKLLGLVSHFWTQWSELKSSQSLASAREPILYNWIKIKKTINLFRQHVPESCQSMQKWKIISKRLDESLELPEETSDKLLLWKQGSHPKLHSSLSSALGFLKLQQVCQVFNISSDLSMQYDARQTALLQELNLIQQDPGSLTDTQEFEFRCQIVTLSEDRRLRKTLLDGLSMASLAAYCPQSDEQSDQVITEVLEECMKEVQTAKKRLSKTSGLEMKADNYDLFFFGHQVFSPGVSGFQSDLWSLHWLTNCSKSITSVFDLMLESTGVRNPTLEVRRRATEELKSWVAYATERCLLPIGQFLPHRDLLWMLEMDSAVIQQSREDQLSLMGNLLYQWHRAVSMTEVQFQSIPASVSGPSVFYQGYLVHSIESILNKMPMVLEAPHMLQELKLAARHLFLFSSKGHSQNHWQDLKQNILVSLCQILIAHLSSLPTESQEPFKRLLESFCVSVMNKNEVEADEHLLRCLRLQLGYSQHQGLVSSLDSWILPCCQNLIRLKTMRRLEFLLALGQCWVYLGALRVRLVAPPAGVDPSTKHQRKAQHLLYLLHTVLKPKLELREEVSRLPGGFDETDKIQRLQEDIHQLEGKIEELKNLLVARPEPSQYLDLHHHLSTFLQSYCHHDRIQDLINDLKSCQKDGKSKAENWIMVCKSFIKQTESRFPLYMDIWQPLFHGLLEIVHGLSALIAYMDLRSADQGPSCVLINAALSLMRMDSNAGLECTPGEIGQAAFDLLSVQQSENVDQNVCHLQLACSHAILHSSNEEINLSRGFPTNKTVKERFQSTVVSFMKVFEKLEDLEEKKAQEKNQVFKTQTFHGQTDGELDEMSYKSMFADETGYFADLAQLEHDEHPASTKSSRGNWQQSILSAQSFLDGTMVKELVYLHREVFGNQKRRDEGQNGFEIRFQAGLQLLDFVGRVCPRYYDDLISSGGLLQICRLHSRFSKKPLTQSEDSVSIDFNQGCPEEVQLTHQCLFPLNNRLEELLEDWPEHPLLCQILEVSKRVLSLPFTCPLRRVLVGLELLLSRAQLWEETVASTKVSLESELRNVSGLVTRWLRLELENWKSLLTRVAKQHAEEAHKTWFYILRILSPENSESLQLEAVISSLEQYLMTSTQGEFSERLCILSTFQKQVEEEGRDFLSNILSNLVAFYRQYEKSVKETLECGMKSLEGELLDFVKLQKWEYRRYFHLMKSGEKSQRKIHRFSKRAEEILKQPFASIFGQVIQSMGYPDLTLESPKDLFSLPLLKSEQTKLRGKGFRRSCGEMEKLLDRVGLKEYDGRLKELPRLLNKMEGIVNESWVRNDHSTVESITEITSTILARLKTLQQDKEKNSKNRKKKALSDLLAFLPGLGVSKIKADVPEGERSVLCWFKQPPLDVQVLQKWKDPSSEEQEMFEKADGYYYRCLDRMQRIWDSSKQPHKDLSLSEVQTMINFSEHFLYLMRSQRQMISTFHRDFSRVKTLLNVVEGLDLTTSGFLLPDQQEALKLLRAQWDLVLQLKRSAEAQKELLLNLQLVEDYELVVHLVKKCLNQCDESLEVVSLCFNSLVEVQKRTMDSWFVPSDIQIINKNFDRLIGLHGKLEIEQRVDADLQKLRGIGIQGETLKDCVPGWAGTLDVIESIAKQAEEALKSEEKGESIVEETQLADIQCFGAQLESCVLELMLWFQNQLQQDHPVSSVSIPDTNERFLRSFGFNKIAKIQSSLSSSLQSLYDLIKLNGNTGSSDLIQNSVELGQLMKCLNPAGHLLAAGAKDVWFKFVEYHRLTNRLCYVVMSVFLGLLREGFCQPDTEQDEGEVDGDFDCGDGTGLADGEGLKDVSEEIENEDQVVGTKERQSQPQTESKEPESKGIEMENDFEGEYENVEQEEPEEDQEAGEDEERLEDEMGKVGEEGETVDEKLWDGEDEDLNEKEQNTEKQYEDQEPAGEEEYMEGRLEDSETDHPKEQENKKKPEIIEREGAEEELSEEGDEEMDEEGKGKPTEGFTKPEVPDEELELPNDLKLDGDEGEDEDSLADSENENHPEVEEPAARKFDDEASSKSSDMDDQMDMDDEQHEALSQDDKDDFVPDPQGDEAEEEGVEDSEPDEIMETATAGNEERKLEENEKQADQMVNSGMGGDMNDSKGVEAENQCVVSQDGPVGDQQTGDQNLERQNPSVDQKTNPLRSLGDALKEWKEDMKVADPDSEERKEQGEDVETDEYEFLMTNDEDLSFQQTLAHATEEQMAEMKDLNITSKDNEESELQEQEEEKDSGQSKELLQEASLLKEKHSRIAGQLKQDQSNLNEEETEIEMMETEEAENPIRETLAQWKLGELDSMEEDLHHEEREVRQELEAPLRESFEGQKNWNQCVSATSSLASELTEHLRLILEPTLASRLAGNYRTGKRINMKRVIPYIASQYRKDKIWLRRTKPDKRKYQVVLAVDDSKSMKNMDCGNFALEALTLISRAMSRLEVGDIRLLSFGGSEKINTLHPLGVPFTDTHGPQVLNQMKFDQDNRIEDQPMVDLIHSLQKMLNQGEKQHHGRGPGHELHQLVTIIADGRFHERSVLRKQAHELCSRPGVLVSFIILDNTKNSLVNMETVSFEDGQPQFKKYLDSFPFPYYIILNDIAALPRTLADLLRQWFQISSYGI